MCGLYRREAQARCAMSGMSASRTKGPILAAMVAIVVLWGDWAPAQERKSTGDKVDPEALGEIRKILLAKNFGDHVQVLIDMDSAAYPAYVVILRDRSAAPIEISHILSLVARQKGDRGAFLPFAQKMVGHKDAGIRGSAAVLLGEIGGAKDAALLVPLLSDSELGVQYWAAGALAKIGTEKELEAFDRRLAAKHALNFPDHLDDIRECRDKLK